MTMTMTMAMAMTLTMTMSQAHARMCSSAQAQSVPKGVVLLTWRGNCALKGESPRSLPTSPNMGALEGMTPSQRPSLRSRCWLRCRPKNTRSPRILGCTTPRRGIA
eukprot:7564318-Alexandrium_andersonii.AAC.1